MSANCKDPGCRERDSSWATGTDRLQENPSGRLGETCSRVSQDMLICMPRSSGFPCLTRVLCPYCSVADVSGEIHGLITEQHFTAGVYRVEFDTKTYWKNQTMEPFHEWADVSVDKQGG